MTKISNQYSLTNILTADLANSRLGINNVSPTVALDVTGAGRISSSLGVGSAAAYASTTLLVRSNSSTSTNWAFIAEDNATNQIFGIRNNGNVGIGTGSPLNALDVRQANATMGNYQTIQAFSSDSAGINLGGGISLGGFYTSTTLIAQFASIVGRKENATSGNYDGYLAFGTNAQATGVVERMRITSAGNVGIGTTTPDVTGFGWTTLTIRGGTTSGSAGVLELQSPTTNANGQNMGVIAFLDGSNRNAQISVSRDTSTSTANILFYTNAGAGLTERMRITSGGIVNLYSPSTNADSLNLYNSSGKLNIKMGGGGAGANQSSLSMYNSANTLTIGLNGAGDTDPSFITGYLAIGTTTNSGYRLYVNGTSAGTSAFQNVSDRRFKKDVTPIESALNIVKLLNGVSFNWNKDSRPDLTLDDKNHLGLIAQDVEEILPQVVSTGEDELQTKTISYSDIVPVLIEAIKELSAENTSLINRIEALENK